MNGSAAVVFHVACHPHIMGKDTTFFLYLNEKKDKKCIMK